MKKIAIVGVEGSGKTVLMAAMGDKYESPDANGVFLKPVNRETYSYYTKEMAKLRSGNWPLATESSVLELEWMLIRQLGSNSVQEQLGLLSFLDFGGEVYRLAFGDKSQTELDALGLDEQRKNAVERLKAHVENADALIVLVNLSDIINGRVDDEDKKKAESTIEMNWLSQAILSFAYEKSQRQKDVALVFTQVDTYAETISECGGIRGTLAKYLRVVDSNYGSRLSLFGVAAVDKTIPARDDSGLPMPAPDFTPQGLEPLLGWIVRQVEPRRKRRTGLFAFGALLIGAASAYVGYNQIGDFKNWVDGQLTAIGWAQKETSVYTELPPAAPADKPAEEPRKPPVEPAKPPKEESKWIAGVSNPNNPNLVAGKSRNTWVATRPGYVWIEGTDRDEWKQGLRHPDNSRLVSDWQEGEWKSTEEGYVWAGGSRTEWRAGIESTKHPHWVSIISDEHPTDHWLPKPGYAKKDKDAEGLSELVWTPGLMDGGRKAASTPGHWLRRCSSCYGRGKKDCGKCDGDGRINCSECRGSGRVETTVRDVCGRCNGNAGWRCKVCNGAGKVLEPEEETCRRCRGEGEVRCSNCHGMKVVAAGMFGFVPCWKCSGTGRESCPNRLSTSDHCVNGMVKHLKRVECIDCLGTGTQHCDKCNDGYRTRQTTKRCADCSGRGTVICPRSECHSGKVSCSSCNGDGWVAE